MPRSKNTTTSPPPVSAAAGHLPILYRGLLPAEGSQRPHPENACPEPLVRQGMVKHGRRPTHDRRYGEIIFHDEEQVSGVSGNRVRTPRPFPPRLTSRSAAGRLLLKCL